MDILQHNRQVYNAIATYFFEKRQEPWQELNDLARYAQPGDAVLDLGCGFGRLYHVLEEKQVHYTGVDYSEEQIRVAQETFPNLHFVQAEMSQVPCADHSFHVVYCIAAFHHLPPSHRSSVVKEMKRLLKPGGSVIMTNWNLDSRWARNQINKGKWSQGEQENEYVVPWKNSEGKVMGDRMYYRVSAKELKEFFEQYGFVEEEQYYVKNGKRVNMEEGQNMISIFMWDSGDHIRRQ